MLPCIIPPAQTKRPALQQVSPNIFRHRIANPNIIPKMVIKYSASKTIAVKTATF
jgi:hypothetical protein